MKSCLIIILIKIAFRMQHHRQYSNTKTISRKIVFPTKSIDQIQINVLFFHSMKLQFSSRLYFIRQIHMLHTWNMSKTLCFSFVICNLTVFLHASSLYLLLYPWGCTSPFRKILTRRWIPGNIHFYFLEGFPVVWGGK